MAGEPLLRFWQVQEEEIALAHVSMIFLGKKNPQLQAFSRTLKSQDSSDFCLIKSTGLQSAF